MHRNYRLEGKNKNNTIHTSNLISLDTMLQEQPRENVVKILNILILQLD